MHERIKAISQYFQTQCQTSLRQLSGKSCLACQKSNSPLHDNIMCEACFKQIKKPQYYCRVCGHAMTAATNDGRCKTCIESPPAYESLQYIGTYHGLLAEQIIAAKLAKQVTAISVLRYLVQQHSECISDFNDYHLLAMPTPTSRLISRGFNLPTIIAKDLSRQHYLPLLPAQAVTLPFWVKKQAKLSKAERQKNVHGYQIHHKLPSKILIIDDIVTTGQTLHELAKSLRIHGVKSVAAWAISRGKLD